MSGRHRFGMKKHKHAYKIFSDAMDEHPEWEVFMDDMGASAAPMEYNAVVESVYRRVAKDDPFSLGANSLRSRESWGHTGMRLIGFLENIFLDFFIGFLKNVFMDFCVRFLC